MGFKLYDTVWYTRLYLALPKKVEVTEDNINEVAEKWNINYFSSYTQALRKAMESPNKEHVNFRKEYKPYSKYDDTMSIYYRRI